MRLATVTCEDEGTVLSIRKRDLFELLREFPQLSEVWASAAWRRERLRCNALRQLLVGRGYRDFAAATIQRALRARRIVTSKASLDKSQPGNLTVSTSAPSAPLGICPFPRPSDGAPVTEFSNGQASGCSQKHLKLMASPEQAQSYLLREVEQLRTGMDSMQADMQMCCDDAAEVKLALQALLNRQGADKMLRDTF